MLDEVGEGGAYETRTEVTRSQASREESLQATMEIREKLHAENGEKRPPCKSFGDKLFKNPTMIPGFYTKTILGYSLRAHFETFARGTTRRYAW